MQYSKDDQEKKLDWMYKKPGQSVNHEEYLLGRSIDKEFEALAQEERLKNQVDQGLAPKNHVEHECVPFSIRSYRDAPQEQVDMARKLQEDPLVAIKKREIESRQQLLQNPVKLKELHRILKEEKMKKIKKKKKKKDDKESKHKKSKRKHKEIGTGNLDDLLAEKYAKLKATLDETLDMGNLLEEKKERPRNKHSEGFSRDERRNVLVGKYENEKGSKQDFSRRTNHSKSGEKKYSDEYKDQNKEIKRYRSEEDDSKISVRKLEDNRSIYSSHKRTKYERTSTGSPPIGNVCKESREEHQLKNNYGLVTADGKRIELKGSGEICKRKSDVKVPIVKKSSYSKIRPKLSEEEIEKRRKEMYENALWRDKELESNIKKYKEEDKKEHLQNNSEYDTEFLKKQLARAADQGSLESRIKANINNIQRSGRAMDKNFAKR